MATFGDILASLAMAAGQVVRRKADDSGFEAFTPAGTGDVVGPASSTSSNLASFNGTTGKAIQDSGKATTLFNGVVPVGGIIMWSGTVATIPANWALCDGNNSTPDLRDKFIVGAKQDDAGVAKTNISGSLTQSGGSKDLPNHTHDLASHTHDIDHDHASVNSGNESAHTHGVTSNVTSAANTGTEASHTHDINHDHASFNSGNESAHTHAITQAAFGTSARGSSGSTVNVYNSGGTVTTPSGAGSSHNHAVDVPALGTTASGAGASHSHSAPALTNNAVTSGAGSSHNHAVDVPALGTTASGAPSSNTSSNPSAATVLNPYYALAFIMRTA